MRTKPQRQRRISVRNLQRGIRVNSIELQKFATKALDLCLQLRRKNQSELERLSEISVLIVSDSRIAALHEQFMNETGPTDVITFQHGEIFISAATARAHARRFGNSLKRELHLYIVHGLLHLCGYEDRDEAQAKMMRAEQEQILAAAEGLK